MYKLQSSMSKEGIDMELIRSNIAGSCRENANFKYLLIAILFLCFLFGVQRDSKGANNFHSINQNKNIFFPCLISRKPLFNSFEFEPDNGPSKWYENKVKIHSSLILSIPFANSQYLIQLNWPQ